jgi:hypothetical protein
LKLTLQRKSKVASPNASARSKPQTRLQVPSGEAKVFLVSREAIAATLKDVAAATVLMSL